MSLKIVLLKCLQANCGLDGSLFSTPSSLQSIARHHSDMSNNMGSSTSGHDLSYGGVQQHWDNNGGTTSMSYFKREDTSLSTNTNNGSLNYSGTTNLVRDVSFSTGMELESCVSLGSYTNFHYNTRPQHLQQQASTDTVTNFATQHHPQHHLQSHHSPLQFSPNDRPPRTEDSFDLFSTFREDSYSENSDEFSNESGEQQQGTFPIVPCSTNNGFNNGHNNSMNNNHSVDGLQNMDQQQHRYNGDSFFRPLNHEAPPVHSISDTVSYHHHGNMLPDHGAPSPVMMTSHHHHQQQQEHAQQHRLYNIMSGSDLLQIMSSGDQQRHPSIAHYNMPNVHYNPPTAFTVSHMTHGVYSENSTVENNSQLSFMQPSSYTEINQCEETYSKDGLCNEQSQSASSQCQKNGFQPLQLEEQYESTTAGENNVVDENKEELLTTDNFGEIIKKTMVETVSA